MNPGYKKTLKSSFLIILITIIIWQVFYYFKLIDSFWFPSPHKIISTAYRLFRIGIIQNNIFATLKRFIPGFIIGSFFGLIVGFLCGMSRKLSVFLEPLIYLVLPIPRFALLPFMILIFGTGIGSQIIYIAIGAFFPVVINTISGINQINKNFVEAAMHYGAKGWRLYKRIILPGSMPSIFIGLRLSAGLSLTYVTVIEFLTATDGVGAMIWLSLQTLRMDKLFLGVALVALLNVLFISLLNAIEHILVPWNLEQEEVFIQ